MPQALNAQLSREQQIAQLEKDWATNPRWKGIKRGYSAADVVRLRGSFQVEHTLARRGAEKLWDLLHDEPHVNCLGALTGGQASRHAAIAGELGMTEGAVKTAAHRMRRRYRTLMREEIAQTVAGPEEIEDEIRYLLSCL